ncbi:hypothetical protein P171DRAFT_494147 [Karstenula rhodostoma CBS 690.94]|uniref:Uncharacterized protein n=1 Tax=Karstenula rhodostoma CBS 690.94 TaxID=1392251 RepID=A0A9P4UBD9_9PLEO|nr:hypothetical protein P171DRAFT_494147 [Karstenula rhodostoma CBS 690.94]
MAAAVALEVFGLFVGGILGIVDLLLPPPEIPTSPLQQGHSLLRFGIGLNSSVPQSLGGTIPSVRVWNEEGILIGSAVGASSRDVQPGTFKTVEVVHNDSYLFQQPTYLEIAGGSDAVCLAYIAQTWADGTQLGWLGDMGKYCGTQWYYSNLFPYCTWIGGPRPSTCSYYSNRNKRQSGAGSNQTSAPSCMTSAADALFTYSGFKAHMTDFGPVGVTNDFQVPDDPKSLCLHPKLEWYKDYRFVSPAPSLKPLFFKAMFVNTLGILSLIKSAAGASVSQVSSWTHDEGPEVSFKARIIASHHAEHSSRELCTSTTSYGPDFVSFDERMFCDMTQKQLWPLCNEKVTKKCYDWHSHTIVDGRRRKREVRYAQIEEWR